MPYFFCNIGWMECYEGQTSGERITGGGDYVEEEGMGYEICNFAPYGGKVYGYVQPASSSGKIKIERLGADSKDESISGVTVIWTAKHPQGGTVVVGWYKNATVYRHYVKFPNLPTCHEKNEIDHYRIEASEDDAELLLIDERNTKIPRGKGGMGQSNVWYADAPESKPFLKKIDKLLDGEIRTTKG